MFTASFLNEFNDGERKFKKFNTFNEALDFLRTEANEREAWYCQITDDETGKSKCISNLYLKGLKGCKTEFPFYNRGDKSETNTASENTSVI